MQRWLVLGLVLALGCSDRTLTVPLAGDDRSLVLLRAGSADALACEVAAGCPEVALGHDAWEVLVLVYAQTLPELGLHAGSIQLLDPGSELGDRFPRTERAFTASLEAPELNPARIDEALLYLESRYDPDAGCPRWYELWSSRPGSSNRVRAILALDERTSLVFAAGGQLLRVRDTGEPEVLGAGPEIKGAGAAMIDGQVFALSVDQHVHRVSGDGQLARVDTIPPLPQSIETSERAYLAGDGPGSLYLQLVSGSEERVHTSTVWYFDGDAWSIHSRDPTGISYRAKQDLPNEVLVRGIQGEVFSSELPDAPLVRLTAGGERLPVPELLEVDQVVQLRRLGDDRLLVVSRIERQARVQLASLAEGGELVIERTFDLPQSPNWLCAEAERGGLLCTASDGFAAFLDGPSRCEDVLPPTLKSQRWMLRLGDGWLVQAYEEGGIDSIHRIGLE